MMQQENKLWKNTYINEQIVKRKQGGNFELNDHIRAMVYSMLSSRTEWAKIQLRQSRAQCLENRCSNSRVHAQAAVKHLM